MPCNLSANSYRTMADHAFGWARDRALLRINAIHGEEEAKLVLEDFFEHNQQDGSSLNQTGSFTLQAAMVNLIAFFPNRTRMVPSWPGTPCLMI